MNEPVAHSGVWILALIMIVVASWYLYKYMAPTSWHEWAGAGVVQAFIIALYAEMYGFPLTIYLLARFGGLDRTELNANLWSSLLGIGETGMMIAMVLGYILLFLGVGLFFQGWRQVYKARQENRLVTDGLYALARHPQYTGLFIALFGEGIVHWPTVFSVGLFPVIIFIYYRLSLREEKKVIAEFEEEYLAYKAQVPMFIPRIVQWKSFFKQAQM
ncbi:MULTISPECIES: isoprenylcysteine carboxylmethyltransferase family protein [Alteromonadaceae]|jgi:protein-S-isoprenylcysteine O-methyltransferase Ste14|uniref:Isoprenylcysteine carboxylmethyltransferase family protein n=1 Tax=Brumicola blandensis TaxID=3075611 RepID=A0AAW8QXJ2_9ALTE|nr:MULTISPECIES: isoprenylcysteine carboxylmethyltransferase family protein [unclassified Alteromonas]MDT0581484.1 isoprenylcysteine carboxylmethyltransferase family protein [Alteromonas sp. W409]MDT0627102.1 isoprenylcysteine carboxylmethyltransferase family protein [Alteromonas sp. W364]